MQFGFESSELRGFCYLLFLAGARHAALINFGSN